jgi:hypothetical protein
MVTTTYLRSIMTSQILDHDLAIPRGPMRRWLDAPLIFFLLYIQIEV